MNSQVRHGATPFGRETTLKWQVSGGDYVLWLRWKDLFASAGTVNIIDFWAMKDGDTVTITNRIGDLPPWFELHPTEVSGSLAYRMMDKLKVGYEPREAVDAGNLWRILAGDRVVWVGPDRPDAKLARGVRSLLDFGENALAIGESHTRHLDPLTFGALSDPEQPPEAVALARLGVEAVRRLGMPRVLSTDSWTLG